MEQAPDPQARRNSAALGLDWIAFGAAQSFVSASTVLPAFVAMLSASPLLVGLISTVANSGWLLPQLFAASRFGHQRRKMRYIIRAALVGRPTFWITGLVLLLAGATSPGLVLVVFFLGYALFNVCDGIGAVAWFDVLGKVVPPLKRGRYIGGLQLGSALVGMGIGVVIRFVLGDNGPLGFPSNFAALFLVAGVFLGVSILAYHLVREPEGIETAPALSVRQYAARLGKVLRGDPDFLRLTLVRVAMVLGTMASPFYVVYATQEVGLGAGAVGLFLSAQVAGGFVGSLGFGYLSSRFGTRLTTIVEFVLLLCMPVAAIVFSLTLASNPGAFGALYALVFVLMGAFVSSHMLGHMSYLLEMAPPEERTTYVGLSNTITGLFLFTPLLAGWIVSVTSYRLLFGVCAALAVVAVVLSLRLREPRRR